MFDQNAKLPIKLGLFIIGRPDELVFFIVWFCIKSPVKWGFYTVLENSFVWFCKLLSTKCLTNV